MKKNIGIIISVLCIVIMATSCKPKLKQVNGHITYFKQDTMRVVVEGEEKMFLTENAQFPAGAVMDNDSVEIIYVEDMAKIVRLIPRRSRIIDTHIDKSKPLLTAPASKDNAIRSKQFVEMMKEKNNHKLK